MKNIKVETERMFLVPNSIEQMKVIIENETDPEMQQAYREMLAEMEKIVPQEEWACEWNMILKENNTKIGGLGYKGIPDAKGFVEIGYGVNEEYRGRGIAKEAVKGMVQWAFENQDVTCVLAQTEEDNHISQAVLKANGFVRDGYGYEGPLFKKYRD